MSYSDGLQLMTPRDSGGDQEIVQFEASAGDVYDFYMPVEGQVEEFGVSMTENVTAQATDPIFVLQIVPKNGGAAVTKITLKIGTDNGNLKRGDNVQSEKVALVLDADIANGDLVLCKRSALPLKYNPGDILRIRHDGAGTGAGGSGVPFLVVRNSLSDLKLAKVWADYS